MALHAPGIRSSAAALALGLGIAVGSGAGVAGAAPLDGGSSTADSGSRATETDSAPADGSGSEVDESGPEKSDEPDNDIPDNDEGSTDEAEEPTSEEPTVEEPTEEPTVEQPESEEPSGEVEAAQPEVPVVVKPVQRPDKQHDLAYVEVESGAAQPEATDVTQPEAVPVAQPEAAAPAIEVVAQPEPADTGVDGGVEVPEIESTALTAPPAAAVVSNVLTGFAALFGFHGGSTAPGPIDALVMAAWEWTRRTFFNPGPEVVPVQHIQTDAGQIVGTVGAKDPFGGPLVYIVVTAPERGSVTIAEDGTFVYTPTVGLAVAGGQDSFVVEVSQPGFHINVLNLFASRKSQATIGLSLNAVPGAGTGLGSTKGFDVYNASSVPMKYTGYYKDGVMQGGPLPGSVIQPGEKFHFELLNYALYENMVVAQFETERGQVDILLDVLPILDPERPDQASCWASSGNACAASGTTAMVMDPAGTVIVVPSSQSEKQAQILNTLCQNDSRATCSFKATRSEETQSESRAVGGVVVNNSDVQNSTVVTITDTRQSSSSVKLSAKEKIDVLVSAEVTEEYSYTWTDSHTFTQSITVNLPAHTRGGVTATQPVFRVYGDFTLTMGNSTWIIRDVYFDSPNPNGVGEYVINTTPIGADELAL